MAQSGGHTGTDVAEKVTGSGGRVCVAAGRGACTAEAGQPALPLPQHICSGLVGKATSFTSHRLSSCVMLVSG